MAQVSTTPSLQSVTTVGATSNKQVTLKNATAATSPLILDCTSSAGSAESLTLKIDGVTQAAYGLSFGVFTGFAQPNAAGNIFFGIGTASAYVLVDGNTATVGIGGTLSAGPIICSNVSDSALTSGRFVIAGASGLLADDADATFSGDTATFTKLNVTSAGGNISSGTYTPTRSAEANLDSNVTLSQAQYSRVRDVVTVSGRFTADPTLAATATSFEITLPIASNLGAVEDLAGIAFCGTIAGMGAAITGSVANDKAVFTWVSSDITSQSWSYSFTYRVI